MMRNILKNVICMFVITSVIGANLCVHASNIGYVIYAGTVWTEINGIKQLTEGAVVVKADGTTETCATLYSCNSLINDVVSIAPTDFGMELSLCSANKLSGVVNAEHFVIGDTPVNKDVSIIDVAALPSAGRFFSQISITRIDGLNLSQGDILYSHVENGEITELILNDVTGDAYMYGYTTETTLFEYSDMKNRDKIILSNGLNWKCNSNFTFDLLKNIPVRMSPHISYEVIKDDRTDERFEKLTADSGMYDFANKLSSYGTTTNINGYTAVINGKEYKISDNIQVFFVDGFNVVQTSLASVSNAKCKLQCYYDKPENKGGRIRVIIAQKK